MRLKHTSCLSSVPVFKKVLGATPRIDTFVALIRTLVRFSLKLGMMPKTKFRKSPDFM